MTFYSLEELEQLGLAKYGNDVYISRKTSLFNPSHISIGNHVRIDDYSVLSAGSGGIEIGDYVHIAVFCALMGKGKISLADFSGLSSRVSISNPSRKYFPAVKLSRAPIMFIKVDFPDPDGPMMATYSP